MDTSKPCDGTTPPKATETKESEFERIVAKINKTNKKYKADFISWLKESHVLCEKHRVIISKTGVCPECAIELKKHTKSL